MSLKYLIFKTLKTSPNKGFTLIELLVTIIIIGILAAIALPSMLGQVGKARATEAKTNLAALNRAQQAFYLENNTFVEDVAQIGKLGIGIPPETANYSITFAPATEGIGVIMLANAKGDAFKSYASGIGLVYQSGGDSPVSLQTLCESTELKQKLTVDAIAITTGVETTGGGQVTCGNNTVAVK